MYRYRNEMDFPVRKSPRLKSYDYTAPGYYFVTICTCGKRCIFGQPGKLNRFGQIAMEKFNQISLHAPSVKIDKFTVMPNHVHGIFVLTKEDAYLPNIIGSYKSSVSKEIHHIDTTIQVWQSSFHDHIIRNQNEYEKIWSYIENNPLKWELDCFYFREAEKNNTFL